MADIKIKSKRYIESKDEYTEWSEPNEVYRVDCLEVEVVNGKMRLTLWGKNRDGSMSMIYHCPYTTDEAINIEIGNFQED